MNEKEFEKFEQKIQDGLLHWIAERDRSEATLRRGWFFRLVAGKVLLKCYLEMYGIAYSATDLCLGSVKNLKEVRRLNYEIWKLDNEISETYSLVVSHDCGCSYHKEAESTDINKLLKQGKKFDELCLRWAIEDKDGRPAKLDGKAIGCKIHNEIMDHLERISSKPDSLIAAKMLKEE